MKYRNTESQNFQYKLLLFQIYFILACNSFSSSSRSISLINLRPSQFSEKKTWSSFGNYIRDDGFLAGCRSFHKDLHIKATGTDGEGAVEAENDPWLYNINLSRATGLDFGTDLSFRWVYVRSVEPGGAADRSGEVSNGHQLIAVNGDSVVGATFDYTMEKISSAKGKELNLTFFKGTREELQKATVGSVGPQTVLITVRQEGKDDQVLSATAGCNLRDVLIANDINVYRSITRWTNCKGKQLCGTCIVNIAEGQDNCSRKSIDERSTLRENPEKYRLSCVTNIHGNITVETLPIIGAAQWTR